MNRRGFFGGFLAVPFVVARATASNLPYRYRTLTASEVSYLMSYPILHRDVDWIFEYRELPNNKLRMMATNSSGNLITADFTVGDLASYKAAKLEIEERIRVRD